MKKHVLKDLSHVYVDTFLVKQQTALIIIAFLLASDVCHQQLFQMITLKPLS